MTETEPTAESRCCGQQPASTKDGPIAVVCILCPNSGRYYADEPGYRQRRAAVEERYALTGSWLPDVPEPVRRSDGRIVH